MVELLRGVLSNGDASHLPDIDRTLERWARRKYKALHGRRRRSAEWLRKMNVPPRCCFATGKSQVRRLDNGSRMTRECHVRFCERLRGKFPRPTHHFGMKLHIGADSHSGLVHSASVTAANVHDSQELPNLLHGRETRLYGDSAYRGKKQRARLKETAPRAKDFTNKPAHGHRSLSDAEQRANRRKSAVRSKVEHPFLTLKRIWGFAKVRYRGLAKNANRAYAMLALINVSKWGRPLIGEVSPV